MCLKKIKELQNYKKNADKTIKELGRRRSYLKANLIRMEKPIKALMAYAMVFEDEEALKIAKMANLILEKSLT